MNHPQLRRAFCGQLMGEKKACGARVKQAELVDLQPPFKVINDFEV